MITQLHLLRLALARLPASPDDDSTLPTLPLSLRYQEWSALSTLIRCLAPVYAFCHDLKTGMDRGWFHRS